MASLQLSIPLEIRMTLIDNGRKGTIKIIIKNLREKYHSLLLL